MTVFMTPIKLLRQTTLPQGVTNSVTQFVRTVTNSLEDLIPNTRRPFVDDRGAKGAKTGEAATPGIRRFVLEHIITTLTANLMILNVRAPRCLGSSASFICRVSRLLGMSDADGRHLESSKAKKVVSWPEYRSAKEVKAFLRLCVYYRIWIRHVPIRAGPLYKPLGKDAVF